MEILHPQLSQQHAIPLQKYLQGPIICIRRMPGQLKHLMNVQVSQDVLGSKAYKITIVNFTYIIQIWMLVIFQSYEDGCGGAIQVEPGETSF